MIENAQLKILYDAMENQKEVTLEFQEGSRKYAYQGYILSLSDSCAIIEEYEGDKEDGIRIEFIREIIRLPLDNVWDHFDKQGAIEDGIPESHLERWAIQWYLENFDLDQYLSRQETLEEVIMK